MCDVIDIVVTIILTIIVVASESILLRPNGSRQPSTSTGLALTTIKPKRNNK